MTPKEKAVELVNKFRAFVTPLDYSFDTAMNDPDIINTAKQCALIAVDEIMESNSDFAYSSNFWADNKGYSDSEIYWQQVKTEIENL